MAREDPQLKLRLTEELKERVVRASRSNNRSVNAEIVAALEEKFPAPTPTRNVQDILQDWAPRIIAETDRKARSKLIDEANAELAQITRQATIGLYPTDDGDRLGLMWQTSMLDEDDEAAISTGKRVFPPTKIKR